MKLVASFAVLILFTIPTVSAANYRVGVSPLNLEMGEVQKGSSSVSSFYVSSAYEGELLVRTTVQEGNIDFFNKAEYSGFVNNYSEQNSSSWIQFINNPISVDGSGDNSGWRPVNFVLNVPEDAEPGYHNLLLVPTPYIPSELGQGVNIVGVAGVNIFFLIEGEATRDISILDINRGEDSGDNFVVDTIVKNTGTVTLMAGGRNLTLVSQDGTIVAQTFPSYSYIKPGEIVALKSFIPSGILSPGDYVVHSTIGYGTGSKDMTTNLRIDDLSPKASTGEAVSVEFPWIWLLVALVIIVGIVIYKKS